MHCSRARFTRHALVAAVLLGLDVSARATTYFSGNVTEFNGPPVQGVTIKAGYVNYLGDFVVSGSAITDAQGNYAISTLDPQSAYGSYELVLDSPGYVIVAYPNQTCYFIGCLTGHPQPVPASYTPPLAGANFYATRSVSISGQARRADTGEVMPALPVAVESAWTGYDPIAIIYTDADGRYTLDRLPPDIYYMVAEPTDGTLLTQGYALRDFDFIYAEIPVGDPLPLQAGQSATGIDFSLHVGASVSGKVVSALDGAAANTSIVVSRNQQFAPSQMTVRTDSDGNYRAGPFLPGSVYLQFGDANWITAYYPGVSDASQSQPITLAGGQQLPLGEIGLIPARSIAGTITDSITLQPLAGATVHAMHVTTAFPAFALEEAATHTDASGHYFLQGLSAGEPHYVWADGLGQYLCQAYQLATTGCSPYAPGGAVTLGAAEHRTSVDFAMVAGATVSGRVYDPDTGFEVPNVSIELIRADKNFGDSALTGVDGGYQTQPVTVGDYYVEAFVGSSRIFYPNCTNCTVDTAQLQHFTAAQNYAGIDFPVPHADLIYRGGYE